jgi:hypothetical protein
MGVWQMTVIKAQHARSLLAGIEECTEQIREVEKIRGRNIKLQVENDKDWTISLSPGFGERVKDFIVGCYLERKSDLTEQLDKL